MTKLHISSTNKFRKRGLIIRLIFIEPLLVPDVGVLKQLHMRSVSSERVIGIMSSNFFFFFLIGDTFQTLICKFFEFSHFLFPSSMPPHTVCNGHHRTEVYLTGHRLPGTLLTHDEPQRTHSSAHFKGSRSPSRRCHNPSTSSDHPSTLTPMMLRI